MNARFSWLSGIGPVVILIPLLAVLATRQNDLTDGLTTLVFVAVPLVFAVFVGYNASKYLRGEQ